MPSVGPAELLIIVLIALIWIGIVVAAFLLVRRGVGPSDPAMDALRTRLAAGEIDEAEYTRLRAVLQGH
jgi:uncharacterized membrane protein